MRPSVRNRHNAYLSALARALGVVAIVLVAAGSLVVPALDPGRPLSYFGRAVWQDELPQSTVSAILQTRDGYLWIATWAGTVRFDGVRFSPLAADLPNDHARVLFEDRDGGVWIGVAGTGLVRWHDGDVQSYTPAQGLGGSDVREALAGVHFRGTLATAYRACLWSRLASRVLMPLAEFDAADEDALYDGVARIDWSEHLAVDGTLAVDAHGSSEALRTTIALLGYRCQVVQRGEVGRPLVEQQHRGFWEFKVTGTGRAVAVRRPSER